MTRSWFSQPSFGRPSIGTVPLHGASDLGISFSDIVSDILPDDITGILGELDSLIAKLPVNLVGQYSARRDECLKENILKKYKCLYNLAQDIKKSAQSGGGQGLPVNPPISTTTAPSEFPIIPVVIGGVAAAALVYALTRPK